MGGLPLDLPRRRRSRLLLVGAGLVLPALLLSLLGIKLLRDFKVLGGTVRAEYGEYIADIAVASLEDAILELEQINMIAARFVPPENPSEVVTFLDRFQRENRLYLMSFFVVPEGLVHYSNLETARTPDYRPIPDWVRDSILATILRQGNIPSGLQHLSGNDPRHPLQVTYFTLESSHGEVLGAAGFVWDLEEIRTNRGFLDRVLGGDLPAEKNMFQGAFFESPMTVTLLDQNGIPFYRTMEPSGKGFITERSFTRVLPFYSVGVQLQNDRYQAWIDRVVWTSLALIAVMLLAIVLAVFFSLRFVLHEIELAELKSTFVSNVSHELKTPLALIRLFSETLEMGRAESPEKAREFLRIIGRESQRLTHLINNVLDVGRIEQGRKTYQFAPTDLPGLVQETLDAYKFSLDKQGFVVESDIETDIPPLELDGEAVTQALINLMDNAIKYSDGERHLLVGLRREGQEVVIRVQDHGMGIPAAEQDRIFEMFYRVEKGLVHNVKGSGLGLSLVRHITEAHGGRIRVESRPGEGSTFHLHFPLEGPRARRDGD